MRLRPVFSFILAGLVTLGVLHAQKPFRQYYGGEYEDFPLPADWQKPAEFTRARLMYLSVGPVHDPRVDTGQWSWGTDYPRTDRHFLSGLKRLTRVDARAVEQVVELDGSDDIFNWPFLYGVEVGHWHLDDFEAEQFQEYLLRGGFFMTDDFHGTIEWDVFMEGMRKVLPGRKVVDIDNEDPIFHVVYDIDNTIQVPGAQSLYYPYKPYEFDGFDPKYRAIYDFRDRIIAGICHNMDIGDAIEYSDDPAYPAESANLAYRIASNYVVYAMTH